ncbi:MAG TPA: BMP family ABC transporter substrate-binding protein [Actinomycetes bacterium]|jgi:basic membrane protein A|nr:BMP family ABC transporter substrate-binding protein [Actinomycetes bacterium]
MKFAPVLLAGVLVMSACGGDDDDAGGGASSPATTSNLKVGLAYDIGGRGDQSFNDAAAAGLDKAKTDFGIAEDNVNELEASAGETDAQKEERLRQLAEGGYNPIIAVGFAYSGPLGNVAKDFPDVKFAIIDDAAAQGANIANLTFAEHEGSFLVGAAAALKSTADHIGFVGGVDVPLIHKFEAGFMAGAKAVNPDITIDSIYLTQPPDFTGFNDAAKGQTAADGMFDAGADVVYHAAGGSGGGVFTAAQEAGKMAIGVDSDQYNTADPAVRDVIITSMIKKVDTAVYDFIESVNTDQFKAGETVFDLEADGVGYSTTGGKIDDIVPQLEEYKAKIISGEITVPSS